MTEVPLPQNVHLRMRDQRTGATAISVNPGRVTGPPMDLCERHRSTAPQNREMLWRKCRILRPEGGFQQDAVDWCAAPRYVTRIGARRGRIKTDGGVRLRKATDPVPLWPKPESQAKLKRRQVLRRGPRIVCRPRRFGPRPDAHPNVPSRRRYARFATRPKARDRRKSPSRRSDAVGHKNRFTSAT